MCRGARSIQTALLALKQPLTIFLHMLVLRLKTNNTHTQPQPTALRVERDLQLLQSLSPEANLSGLLQPLPPLSSAQLFHEATRKKNDGEVRAQQRGGRVRRERRQSRRSAFKGTGLAAGAEQSPTSRREAGQAVHEAQGFLIKGTGGVTGARDARGTQSFSPVFPHLEQNA